MQPLSNAANPTIGVLLMKMAQSDLPTVISTIGLNKRSISQGVMISGVWKNEVVEAFINQGGSAWVLRTNQIGGIAPIIKSMAPITL